MGDDGAGRVRSDVEELVAIATQLRQAPGEVLADRGLGVLQERLESIDNEGLDQLDPVSDAELAEQYADRSESSRSYSRGEADRPGRPDRAGRSRPSSRD